VAAVAAPSPGIRRRLARGRAAFAALSQSASLRRLALALLGSVAAEGVYAVAVAVFAYESGGAAAVAALAVVRPVLAAACSPLAASLADHFRRERVMVATDLARAATLAGMAAFAAAGLSWGVYVLAALLAVLSTAFWPAQAALLPSLTHDPAQLAAANVVTSTIEGFGAFVGPILCALLLIVAGTPVLFGVATAGFLWSALVIAALRVHSRVELGRRTLPSVLGGFRAILADRSARVVVSLFGAQMIVAGALNLLIVVAALQLLHAGRPGVGYLSAAVGIGGLVGVVGAAALVGTRRLATAFGVGLIVWGLPPALIAAWPSKTLALALLVLAGVGFTIVDVAGFTMLQRAVDDNVLARVFGTLESVALIATAAGAGLASIVNGLVGVRGALLATGLLLPAVTVLVWRRLEAIDRESLVPVDRLVLLHRNPIFAPLPPAAIDALASRLLAESHPAGTEIFRQGDQGDRFYLVSDGIVEIDIDGIPVTDVRAGDYFGEIALMRSVPRTATARALTDTLLFSLDGSAFVSAATGHPASADVAEAVVGARLRFRSPSGGLV
jgi:MFS family permease